MLEYHFSKNLFQLSTFLWPHKAEKTIEILIEFTNNE